MTNHDFNADRYDPSQCGHCGLGRSDHKEEPPPPKKVEEEYPVFRVDGLRICEGCLLGLGEQCNTPGCALIRARSLGFDVRENILLHGATITPWAASPSQEAAPVVDLRALLSLLWDVHLDMNDWLRYSMAARNGEIKTPPTSHGHQRTQELRFRLGQASIELHAHLLAKSSPTSPACTKCKDSAEHLEKCLAETKP